MTALDILSINEDPGDRECLTETVWKALKYFPEGLWNAVNYLGNISVKCDLEISSGGRNQGALSFQSLVKRLREARRIRMVKRLLLAVTHEPVILSYFRFEVDRFKRIVNLIRDYVSNDVGLVSLFRVEEEANVKIAAHGLGHNQGLEHHMQPDDLMYESLIQDLESVRIDGFCAVCQKKLRGKTRKA